jgi:multidrug efflux pump
VTVAKATKNFLLVAGLVSPDGSLSSLDLSDLIVSQVQDPISRTNGVGDFQLFGSQYAMRVWLDPARLDNFGLTTVDVSSAITAQNVQVAAGELGGLPSREGQQLDATIIGPSYLRTPEAFGDILLKVLQSGARVRLRDVARVELGAESYSLSSKYNGKPAAGIAIKLASGANALATVAAVKATMQEILPNLPAGVEVVYPYDTSPFVRESIKGVVETLGEAVVLVFLILFLFLQNFRATLIPTIAVPVVLLGTCGVLSVAGYSINSLTLFAMVLAIGLLIDDAIVVVENVERVMRDEKLDPKEATRRSMDQISGALIGIAMVLSAVFLPMAFFGGSAGVIYRQFAITIITAMLLSVAVALIFTPALCATLLRAPKPRQGRRRGLFYWFNRGFDRTNTAYSAGVRRMVKRPVPVFVVFALLVGGLAMMYLRLPSGFLPDEDQGVLFVQVTTPPGATAGTTQGVLDDVAAYFRDKEAADVASVFTVNGFSFGGQGQNAGLAFVILKDWSARSGAANKVGAIVGRAMGAFSQFNRAQVFAFAPPAVLELGNATGFDFELLDRGNKGHEALMAARNQLLGAAAHDPALAQVRPNGLDDEPQYRIDIDREKASALGLTIADINNSLAAAWGSSYLSDFIDRGRVKRVFIQGDIGARMEPGDLDNWYLRNSAGTMTPYSIFAKGAWISGSPRLERYGGIPAIEILGSPAPGQSSGTAIAAMQRLAKQLPPGFASVFTGLSYEELEAGSQTIYLYALALTVVFLSLAALYESWAIPVAVLLVIPLGVIGVVAATLVRGLDNNVYFQVGMLTTIGLAAKNAILIVEFANAAYEQGKGLADAALLAAGERLRPILMTSLAFMLGVLPLAVSTGAGSGGQNAIGTAVVGGMLSATLLAIFFVPAFFVAVLGVFRVKSHFRPTKNETVGAITPAPAA